MNNLELAKVKAFYYAKVVELGGDFEKASALIQIYCGGDHWTTVSWIEEMYFNPDDEYRIKPETVQHPGGEMPKPLSVEEVGKADCIYIPKFDYKGLYIDKINNLSVKRGYANFGIAYATKQDAIDAGHVMFNIPKSE